MIFQDTNKRYFASSKSITVPFVQILVLVCTLFSLNSVAQQVDKNAFCSSLRQAMSAFEENPDSLKGEYSGANSFGIQQWKPRYNLHESAYSYYEYSRYLSEVYRATYVMRENARKADAEALYKQLVSATRSCYGLDFFLQEQETTEYRGDDKMQQQEAQFTRRVSGGNSGFEYPSIRISSTAYETGDTFEVLVELIWLITD